MISTHILDTTKGAPAAGVTVVLEQRQGDGAWKLIGSGETNPDGRIAFDCPKEKGIYRLTFHIEAYFKDGGHFFMDTPIIFNITDTGRKYHVPLLLNPYGYSTYRGS